MHMVTTAKSILMAVMACLLMAGTAMAAGQGTQPEAEALVKKGVALIKSAGADKAYDEFTNGTAFKDRDLYIFVYDLNGKNLAHGANAKLVGKDLIGLKDPDGKPLIQILVDLAKSKGKGWSESFKFRNPVTEKMEEKVVYIERVGDTFIGSGVYKQ